MTEPLPHQDAAGSSAALSVRGLGKSFGSRVAFEDVTFDVGYGEVFGFLGPTARARPRSCGRSAR